MAGIDPLGWIGGVFSGGWIPGYQPAPPMAPTVPATMPQTPTIAPPQQPTAPIIGMTQNAATEQQYQSANPLTLDKSGYAVQNQSYAQYQNTMAKQAQQQQNYANQQAQNDKYIASLKKPFISKNAKPVNKTVNTSWLNFEETTKIPFTNFELPFRYTDPSVVLANTIRDTIPQDIKDLESSHDQLGGFESGKGYIAKTPDPLSAFSSFQSVFGREIGQRIIPDFSGPKATKLIDDNILKATLGVVYFVPPVKQYVDSQAGKDLSKTMGSAVRYMSTELRDKPIEAYAMYKLPTALKGLEYAGAGTIAKAATSKSFPTIAKLGKMASSPTAAEAYTGAKLLAVGGMTYMGAKEIQDAPNTPEAKGKAWGSVIYPALLMGAGLPSAKLSYNKNPLMDSDINKGAFKFNANNPYSGKGYFSGQYEKGPVGKIAAKAFSAYGEMFNKPGWVPDKVSAKSKDQLAFRKVRSKEENVIDRWEVDVKPEPPVKNWYGGTNKPGKNWYGDWTQEALRGQAKLGVQDTHIKIPGTKTYLNKKALYAGGIVAGSALGYLYGPEIRSTVDKVKSNKAGSLLLTGGLVLGLTGVGAAKGGKRHLTSAEALEAKIAKYKFNKHAKFDLNKWKWDDELGMWRELYPEEYSSFGNDLKLTSDTDLTSDTGLDLISGTGLKTPHKSILISQLRLKPPTLINETGLGNDLISELITGTSLINGLGLKQDLISELITGTSLINGLGLKQDLITELVTGKITETPPTTPPKIPRIPPRATGLTSGLIPLLSGGEEAETRKKKKKKAHWETGAAPTTQSVAAFVFGGNTQKKPRKSAKIDHTTSAMNIVFGTAKPRKPAKIPLGGKKTGGNKKLMTPQKISKEVSGMGSGLFTYTKRRK
jgi:hypothetical protein